MYFEGDAKVINGARFKVALATVLVANGVYEKILVGIELHEGSIVAEVTTDGLEYGRMMLEWMDAGLIVVVVDGMTYVAYRTYDSINPYAADNVCSGHVIGNLTFAMDDFGAPPVLAGYAPRNSAALLPSEMYAFQADLEADLQQALVAHYTSNTDFYGEICVTTNVVLLPEHAIQTEIVLSNYSVHYASMTTEDVEAVGMAVARGYKSGEIVIEDVRGRDVNPGSVVLTAVDADFFSAAKPDNMTGSLVGGVVGGIGVCAVLFGLIYRAKLKEEDDHMQRVKMAISPDGLQFYGYGASTKDADVIELNDSKPLDVSAQEMALFGLGLDMPLVGGSNERFTNVAYTSPSGASPSSPGYFSVGEITSPKYLPGPGNDGGSHFYPESGGSLMGVATGPLFGRSPVMADYGRAVETPSGRQTPRNVPMFNPHYREANDLDTQLHAGATKLKGGRPSLVDDEYIDTTDALTSWTGSGAANSPDALSSDSDDGEWGQVNTWGATNNLVLQADHDFPTLRSATMKVGAGAALSGYARPSSPIEINPTVHFAGVGGGNSNSRPSLLADDGGNAADEEYGMAAIALANVAYRLNT